ncbi:TIR domain-containing protein [Roseibium polysiphoniae]|uniref:TIR domain-containing protein n=1 Tax=Roseibium polysiphoniae TaxID=2571221 RepID=UPI001BD1139F
MYYLKERCFIAWGGNQELAESVGKALKGKGVEYIVGGSVTDKSEADDIVNNRIINQMKRSSRAIILAQGNIENGKYYFRPNLMFEWGYLLARLPKGSMMVVLIDTPRESVATDLQGSFSEIIPNNLQNNTEKAKWISKKYIDEKLHDRFSPFDVLYNWSSVKSFFEDQLNGSGAPNPEHFKKLLVSSFIPSIYLNDLEFMENIIKRINENPANIGSKSRILANGILSYCKAATLNDDPAKGDYDEIKHSFSNTSNSHDPYVRAIARNYMGKCLVRTALQVADSKKKELLGFAVEHFIEAKNQFERAGLDRQSLEMWLSYVNRSISKTYYNLSYLELSSEYCEFAMSNRQQIISYLDGSFNKTAKNAFEAEYYLSVLDYVEITGDKRLPAFQEIEGKLNRIENEQVSTIWKKVFRDFQRINR